MEAIYAVHPSALDWVIRSLFAIVPLIALTVIAARMGKSRFWLIWPWLVPAAVVGMYAIQATSLQMNENGFLLALLGARNALAPASAVAVFATSIGLAFAGGRSQATGAEHAQS